MDRPSVGPGGQGGEGRVPTHVRAPRCQESVSQPLFLALGLDGRWRAAAQGPFGPGTQQLTL